MGLFNYVFCELPLPDDSDHSREFHTKDLRRGLDRYTINRAGRLILHSTHTEPVPEAERPYFGTPDWPQKRMIGCVRRVDGGPVDLAWHGHLDFYDARQSYCDQYRAKFTDGALVSIAPYEPAEADWLFSAQEAVLDSSWNEPLWCELPDAELLTSAPSPSSESRRGREPALTRYSITTAGRLVWHAAHEELVPENERPYFGTAEWPERQGIGGLRLVDDGPVELDWHGWVNIDNALGRYRAKFTDGVFVELKKRESS